jgi:NTE family protein
MVRDDGTSQTGGTALVLSGGGAKGAFQLGALEALADAGFGTAGRPYARVAGTSVGALNGAMVAAGRGPGGTNALGELWRSIGARDVFRKRSIPALLLHGLLWKLGLRRHGPLGLYSNAPLRALIERYLGDCPRFEVPFSAGRVDLHTGVYESEVHPGTPHFVDEILASTAIPVTWPPVWIDGHPFVDGGVREITPLGDIVAHEPDRVILITTERRAKEWMNERPEHLLDVAQQTIPVLVDNTFAGDLDLYLTINRAAQQVEALGGTFTDAAGRAYRAYETLFIAPAEPLGDGLDFTRAALDRRIEQGYGATLRALEATGWEA